MFGRLADPSGANNALSQVLYGLALRLVTPHRHVIAALQLCGSSKMFPNCSSFCALGTVGDALRTPSLQSRTSLMPPPIAPMLRHWPWRLA